jgi:hypothetical protein
MRSLIRSLAMVMLAALLATGTLAQTADDEWVGTLLVARDELDAGIEQVDREIAAIPGRIASDDWRVFPTASGGAVELDLNTLEDYVPMAQVVAGHPEIKQALLDGLEQANKTTWVAVRAMDAMSGGIENLPAAEVVALVKQFYSQSADDKRDAYAAHLTKLKAERDDLVKLRAEMQAELDRIAAAAATPPPSPLPSVQPSPAVTPEASPDPTSEPSAVPSTNPSATPSPEPTPDLTPDPTQAPGDSGNEVEYDALIGLTVCDENDPTCDSDDAVSTETTPVPTAGLTPAPTPDPTPELTLEPTTAPEPTPEPTPAATPEATPAAEPSPEPLEPGLEPTLAPTIAPTLEPTLAPTSAPCPEADMWCIDEPTVASPAPSLVPSPEPPEPLGESAIDKLMGCWGNEQGCYAPLPAEISADGLWDAGLLEGEWEQGKRSLRLVQDGSQVSGTYEGQKGPIVIEAKEVSRNRIEGNFYGDFFWYAHMREDEDGEPTGEYTGSLGYPEDGVISCSESRSGTTLWGQIEMELNRWEGDGEPAAHLEGTVAPCDEAWREDNARFAYTQRFSPDRLVPPPEGSTWADAPADPARPWAGDWQIDFGSMRLDHDGNHIDGVVLSPGGLVTFSADPTDPAVYGEWYDPEFWMVGEWRGDAFGAWLASYGAVPATWQCAEARDGEAQWGEIWLRIGGMDGEAPNRIDAAWMPCDGAWRESSYDDDWWYDGEDRFRGWRLADSDEPD